MRKGFSIIELLVVIAILTLISVSLSRLSLTTIRDIPASYRVMQAGSSMLNAAEQIRRDVNAAISFPKLFGDYTANSDTLLIELEKETICYQFRADEILRHEFANDVEKLSEKEVATWHVPGGRVEWRLWQKDGRGYAVELRTYIEQNLGGHPEKKMANSHVYFKGSLQEAVR